MSSGFTGGVNWYRNLDRNWHLLGEVDPIIHQPALMIYGDRDTDMQAPNLADFPDPGLAGPRPSRWPLDQLRVPAREAG